MTPPLMAGWNMGLRFGLEFGAVAGLGAAAWRLTSGGARPVAVVAAPVAAAAVWGGFNVLDDPSRSGAAPSDRLLPQFGRLLPDGQRQNGSARGVLGWTADPLNAQQGEVAVSFAYGLELLS